MHRVDPAAHADKDACDPEKEAKLASRISSEGVMSAKMGLVRRAVESNSDLPGQVSWSWEIGLGLGGYFLYIGGVLCHVEWCIRQV